MQCQPFPSFMAGGSGSACNGSPVSETAESDLPIQSGTEANEGAPAKCNRGRSHHPGAGTLGKMAERGLQVLTWPCAFLSADGTVAVSPSKSLLQRRRHDASCSSAGTVRNGTHHFFLLEAEKCRQGSVLRVRIIAGTKRFTQQHRWLVGIPFKQ